MNRPQRRIHVWPAIAILAVTGSVFLCTIQADAQRSPQPQSQPEPQPKPVKHSNQSCVSATDAAQQPNKDICVSAHIFDIVELPDGTRFLDTCPPDLADAECRFTILSLPADRGEVGDLTHYRDQDVHIRGIIRSTHGRMGIVLSHARQFNGGPEKFKPNPKLLRGFNAQSDRMPVRDPNLAPTGRHRAFMDRNEKEPVAAKK